MSLPALAAGMFASGLALLLAAFASFVRGRALDAPPSPAPVPADDIPVEACGDDGAVHVRDLPLVLPDWHAIRDGFHELGRLAIDHRLRAPGPIRLRDGYEVEIPPGGKPPPVPDYHADLLYHFGIVPDWIAPWVGDLLRSDARTTPTRFLCRLMDRRAAIRAYLAAPKARPRPCFDLAFHGRVARIEARWEAVERTLDPADPLASGARRRVQLGLGIVIARRWNPDGAARAQARCLETAIAGLEASRRALPAARPREAGFRPHAEPN